MSPGITGDIFNLSADAQYEGRWHGLELLRANAGIDVRLTTELEANLCHGIEIAVRARASAEARAALAVFVAAAGEVSAFAQAGANVKVSLAPDLFDRFGLVIDVGAFAEAAVAGRLSIGLDIGQIKGLAAALIDDEAPLMPNPLALKIFSAFLDEVQIGAGVWGRAAFSAMARAHLEVYGSLADPERAGFVFEMGGALGFEAGTGWDFFAFARMVDVHRFYARASDLITAEIVRIGRSRLDSGYEPALQMLDLCLPAVLQVALVAGQTAASSMIADSDRVVEPTVLAILEQMRRFMLRKLVEVGERMLTNLVADIAEWIAQRGLDDDARDALHERVAALITLLEADKAWNIDTLSAIATQTSALVDIVMPDAVSAWREPLAVAWCGLAIMKSLDEAGGGLSASAGASLGGFGSNASLSEQDFALADAPQFVLDALEEHLGARPIKLNFSDAVDYIGATQVAPHLDVMLPGLTPLIELLETHLALSPGDVVSAFLLGTAGGNIGSTALYRKLRALLRETIEGHIDASLIPALRGALGENDDARLYLAEVVEPSLLGCTHFVFERLDQVVAGNHAAAFGGSFQIGLSNLVYKVFARNVIVLGHILVDHVLSGIEDSLGELRDDVAENPNHILAVAAGALVQPLVPGMVPAPTVARATHRLVEQMIAAGQQVFGASIWTAARRTALRHLLLEALVGDDLNADYRSSSGLEAVFADIAQCNHVPNASAVGSLGGLLADLVLDQVQVAVELIVPALAEFFLAITTDVVFEMDRRARAAIEALASYVDEALRQLAGWIAEVDRLLDEVEALALETAGHLTAIASALGDEDARNAILDRLRADGVASVILSVAAITPGWSLMDANARAAVLTLPLITFETAFDLARPLLANALEVLGDLSAVIGDAIVASTRIDDVVGSATNALANAVRNSVNEQIEDYGLVLPEQISVDDVATAAKAILITDEVASWLRAAHTSVQAQNDANFAMADARRQEAEARNRHNGLDAQYSGALGGPLTIRIESPLSLADGNHGKVIYGPRVPISITVDGARPSFVEAGDLRRIFLSVNGHTLTYHAAEWQEVSGGLRYRRDHDFGSGVLSPGLNILECSVADGRETLLRREVRFVLDPDAPVLNAIAVAPDESQFDVPGQNDHHASDLEYVTLVNTGQAPALLEGWELRDDALHRYTLPARTLAPGARLRIVTGVGIDDDERVHWNRRQAVWNNRGDVVRLIDTDGVLRTEYVYAPRAGRTP